MLENYWIVSMLKVRKRDFNNEPADLSSIEKLVRENLQELHVLKQEVLSQKTEEPIAKQVDIVRLEKLVSDIPSADLTAIEKTLRENLDKIESLKKEILSFKAETPDYVFEIERNADNKIERVVARKEVN